MTAVLPAPPAPDAIVTVGRGAGRITVATVVACVAVHGADAVQHGAMSPLTSAATFVVAAGCLLCVPALWTRPGIRSLVHAALGFAAMLVLHLMMITSMRTTSRAAATHAHEGLKPATPAILDTSSSVLTGAAVALPIAGIVLVWLILGRTRPVTRE